MGVESERLAESHSVYPSAQPDPCVSRSCTPPRSGLEKTLDGTVKARPERDDAAGMMVSDAGIALNL